MTKIIIEGGKKIEGVLPVFGSKNASLPIVCASLLAEKTVKLNNVPVLLDIDVLLGLLEEAGANCSFNKKNKEVVIEPAINNVEISDNANKMRASILLLAPLLAKKGEVKIPYPGGCGIGGRPIDITLDGLKALGAVFEDNQDFIIAKADKLKGCEFHLKFPSVGGTEALVMAASVAEGTTVLTNVAKEPEVIDLIDFLNTAGADIKVTDSSIIINGVESLNKEVQHNIISDRIITGTYAVMAALSAGEKGVLVDNCNPEHIASELEVLTKAGVEMEIRENSIFIPQQTSEFKSVDFETAVFPGFATDLQAPMMLFLTQCLGESHVTENIYENRFMHVDELNKMNANITTVSNHIAVVKGPCKLTGASVESTDLRASAALVAAGLIAEGQTIVGNVRHLDRGYQDLEGVLSSVGANIRRSEND